MLNRQRVGRRLDRLVGLLCCLGFLVGCQDAEMGKLFIDGKPVILTDPSGRIFVVEHSQADAYTVKPIEGKWSRDTESNRE